MKSEFTMKSEIDVSGFDFRAGDKVAIADDDWTLLGHDVFLVDAEPVPGSTQCVVRAGNDIRTVSRGDLRHLPAAA